MDMSCLTLVETYECFHAANITELCTTTSSLQLIVRETSLFKLSFLSDDKKQIFLLFVAEVIVPNQCQSKNVSYVSLRGDVVTVIVPLYLGIKEPTGSSMRSEMNLLLAKRLTGHISVSTT